MILYFYFAPDAELEFQAEMGLVERLRAEEACTNMPAEAERPAVENDASSTSSGEADEQSIGEDIEVECDIVGDDIGLNDTVSDDDCNFQLRFTSSSEDDS